MQSIVNQSLLVFEDGLDDSWGLTPRRSQLICVNRDCERKLEDSLYCRKL